MFCKIYTYKKIYLYIYLEIKSLNAAQMLQLCFKFQAENASKSMFLMYFIKKSKFYLGETITLCHK